MVVRDVIVRNTDANSLYKPFKDKVSKLFEKMRERGCDPVIYEARRSTDRQRYLYSIGRRANRKTMRGEQPITWTLENAYTEGKAITVRSKLHGFTLDLFYQILTEEAKKLNLQTFPEEPCRIEYVEEEE